MEYTIKTTQIFRQVIEALILALENKGFSVQRSFDLRSALWDQADQKVNYSILMVEAASTPEPGHESCVLAIYQREEQLILNLSRPCTFLPRHQATEAPLAPLETALVDLLIEKGWWSM